MEDPRLRNRVAILLTPWPGVSAERVEALVTDPIEDKVRELSEFEVIESVSRAGLSFILVELDESITDIEPVWSKVRGKVQDAESTLPKGAGPTRFDDTRGAVAFSLIVGLKWDQEGDPELGVMKRHAEELADRLRRISGTGLVQLFGSPQEEVVVEVDPARMATLGLDLDAVAQKLKGADVKDSAGTFRAKTYQAVMEIEGELDSLNRIAEIPVFSGDAMTQSIALGELAEISKSMKQPMSEIARIHGAPGIMLAARIEDGQRIDQWTVRALKELEWLEEKLGPEMELERIFVENEYTQNRLRTLTQNLLIGAGLVALIVFVMMGWKAAVIVGSALPLSLGLALFGLNVLGAPLHQISVTGLIIALGLLIDNAIVMVDEVRVRMSKHDTPIEAIRGATGLLWVPLLGSTMTTVLAFMPILLLPGNTGEFVETIALSVILALLCSFGVSMTLIPALTGRFGFNSSSSGRSVWWRNGVHYPKISKGFRGLVRYCVTHPKSGVFLGLIFPVLGFALAPGLKKQFFPPADRDQFYIQVWADPGSSIDFVAERTLQMDGLLNEYDEIRSVDWVIGNGAPPFYYNMMMGQDGNESYAQALIHTHDHRSTLQLSEKIQEELDTKFPDLMTVVRVLGQGPPVSAPLEVRVLGPSIDTLRSIGEELRERMQRLDDVTHTRSSLRQADPKMVWQIDAREVESLGLSMNDVVTQTRNQLDGVFGGTWMEGSESLPIRVRYPAEWRESLRQARSLNLQIPESREWVSMAALGQWELKSDLDAIIRRDGMRCNKVLGYLNAEALPPEVTAKMSQLLEDENYTVPEGYELQIGGDAEQQDKSVAALFTFAPALGALMVAIIVLSFRSFLLAAALGVVALMSVGLGLLGIAVSGYPYGFMAIIGTAGLIGVAINDSIVALASIRDNPQANLGDPDAVTDEIMHCSRHILSTTLTTIGGFLPLLLGGNAFWIPLAVVIAGGVSGATALALIFIPSVYMQLLKWFPGLGSVNPNTKSQSEKLAS